MNGVTYFENTKISELIIILLVLQKCEQRCTTEISSIGIKAIDYIVYLVYLFVYSRVSDQSKFTWCIRKINASYNVIAINALASDSRIQ